jgi:hypothetical protein
MTDVKNKISYDETVDEALLQLFFADSARMDIADEGFTDRLMRRLPEEVDARCYRLYRLWTAAMAAVCVAVFFFFNGFQLLKLRVCGAVGGFLALASRFRLLPPVSRVDNAVPYFAHDSDSTGCARLARAIRPR